MLVPWQGEVGTGSGSDRGSSSRSGSVYELRVTNELEKGDSLGAQSRTPDTDLIAGGARQKDPQDFSLTA